MKNNYLYACFLALSILVFSAQAPGAERAKRPMQVHLVKEIGLEIWTEAEPRWETHLESKNGQSTFVAETPDLTYPVAGFMWSSSPDVGFSAADFKEAALGAIHGSARGYGVAPDAIPVTKLKEVSYGDLSGYEATFAGSIQQTPVDVRIFVGHRPGRPLVIMQATTQRGKLDHISEQVRRSWTHVKYLK